MLNSPTQAIQPMRARVRMLVRQNVIIAATATKTEVQVPCDEIAFKAIEMLSIPEPETKIQSGPMYC